MPEGRAERQTLEGRQKCYRVKWGAAQRGVGAGAGLGAKVGFPPLQTRDAARSVVSDAGGEPVLNRARGAQIGVSAGKRMEAWSKATGVQTWSLLEKRGGVQES